MNFHYTDRNDLSKLISSYLEPIDPSPAIFESIRLAHHLLLSNHIDKADELIHALYKHTNDIIPSYKQSPLNPSLTLEHFWQTHRTTHARPENAVQFEAICTRKSISVEAYLANEQWGKYRECCRTGWMLDHCKLPEPADPSIWRETDDPPMLAMCARLLAKSTDQGTYPSQERIREAIAAAKKLYALPQVPVTEWKFSPGAENRHSYLLYWRLAMELAIRAGELETAADILGLGLRLDGFTYTGGDLEDYLLVPGIYDVLPLLAERGKEGNPFFISAEDAGAIVKEISAALELRAREGRQWSLAADKVGWKELLDRLVAGAWTVNRKEYRKMGVRHAEDILYSPATEEEIAVVEEKVGDLPADFKEMIVIANGFQGGWHFLSGGLAGIQQIGISDEDLGNYASDFAPVGMRQDGIISGDMVELQPGSDCDGFRHFIIPAAVLKDNVVTRQVKDGEYQYWHWAPWQASIDGYDSVRDWVASCVEKIEEMVANGEKERGDDDTEEEGSDNSDGEDDDSDGEDDDGDGEDKTEDAVKRTHDGEEHKEDSNPAGQIGDENKKRKTSGEFEGKEKKFDI